MPRRPPFAPYSTAVEHRPSALIDHTDPLTLALEMGATVEEEVDPIALALEMGATVEADEPAAQPFPEPRMMASHAPSGPAAADDPRRALPAAGVAPISVRLTADDVAGRLGPQAQTAPMQRVGTMRDVVAPRRRTLTESFGGGIDQAQGMLYGGVEAIGEGLGLDSVQAFGERGREHNEAEIRRLPEAQAFTAIQGVGDFGQWLKETVGNQLPIMAPSMAGGIAGAAIGTAVGGPPGAAIGAVIGAFVPNFAMSVGEVQSSIKERGGSAPGAAFVGGSAIAALDSVLPGKVGGRLVTWLGKEAAEDVATRALLKPAVKGMATEGVTEALQEAIGEYATAQGTGTAMDPNLSTRMIEVGAAGALMGALGGVPMRRPSSVDVVREGVGGAAAREVVAEQAAKATAPPVPPAAVDPKAAALARVAAIKRDNKGAAIMGGTRLAIDFDMALKAAREAGATEDEIDAAGRPAPDTPTSEAERLPDAVRPAGPPAAVDPKAAALARVAAIKRDNKGAAIMGGTRLAIDFDMALKAAREAGATEDEIDAAGRPAPDTPTSEAERLPDAVRPAAEPATNVPRGTAGPTMGDLVADAPAAPRLTLGERVQAFLAANPDATPEDLQQAFNLRTFGAARNLLLFAKAQQATADTAPTAPTPAAPTAPVERGLTDEQAAQLRALGHDPDAMTLVDAQEVLRSGQTPPAPPAPTPGPDAMSVESLSAAQRQVERDPALRARLTEMQGQDAARRGTNLEAPRGDDAPRADQGARPSAPDEPTARYLLQWMAADLRDMPFQEGGVTRGMMRDAEANWQPGDDQGARFGIGPAAARVPGTPLQQMFAAAGVSGSRAAIAYDLERFLAGQMTRPTKAVQSALRFARLMDAAWDGERFDWQRISDDDLAQAGVARTDLRSPVTPPPLTDTDLAPAQRFNQTGLEALRQDRAARSAAAATAMDEARQVILDDEVAAAEAAPVEDDADISFDATALDAPAPAGQPSPADVRASALARVQASPETFVRRYRKAFGRYLSHDTANELHPEYRQSSEARARYRAAVAPASSVVVDGTFEALLAEPTPPTRMPLAIFTSGGTGSGKSEISDVGRAHLLWDATMSNTPRGIQRIDQALAAGLDVRVRHIRRDIDEAWLGTLKRAMNPQEADGRTIELPQHINSHLGAWRTLLDLAEHYKGNPRVVFNVIQNRPTGTVARSVDWLRRQEYPDRDVLAQRLVAILEAEHDAGRVSDAVYAAARQGLPEVAGTAAPDSGRRRAGAAAGDRPAERPVEGRPAPEQPEAPARDAGRVAPPAPRPFTADNLAEVFSLPSEEAVAVTALVDAMGLPTDQIELAKGGTPDDGSLSQAGAPDEANATLTDEFPRVSFYLGQHRNGDWWLTDLVVPRSDRGQGVGTRFMERLIQLADSADARIVLSPGQRGDESGTTSRSRLVRFYKRFGFVENKGRRKDFRISEGMYRQPGAVLYQGLFDDDTDTDLLDTGEAQPRLPGDVGAVRNEERAQPKLSDIEDEFRLAPQYEKRKGVQRPLFQQGDARAVLQRNRRSQDAKASVEFSGLPWLDDAKALIRALTNPDISSPIHEIAHAARRFLLNRDVPAEKRRGISDEDIATTEQWAGAKDGVWSEAAEEKFARAFERFLREGGPTLPSNIREVFSKLAGWLTDVYQSITGSAIDVEITPEVRAVFDRLVTRQERLAAEDAAKASGPPKTAPIEIPSNRPYLRADMRPSEMMWAYVDATWGSRHAQGDLVEAVVNAAGRADFAPGQPRPRKAPTTKITGRQQKENVLRWMDWNDAKLEEHKAEQPAAAPKPSGPPRDVERFESLKTPRGGETFATRKAAVEAARAAKAAGRTVKRIVADGQRWRVHLAVEPTPTGKPPRATLARVEKPQQALTSKPAFRAAYEDARAKYAAGRIGDAEFSQAYRDYRAIEETLSTEEFSRLMDATRGDVPSTRDVVETPPTEQRNTRQIIDDAKASLKAGAPMFEDDAKILRSLMEDEAAANAGAIDVTPVSDTLDTGEQQDRLPGDVGSVRDEERAQPTEDVPEQTLRLTGQDAYDQPGLGLDPIGRVEQKAKQRLKDRGTSELFQRAGTDTLYQSDAPLPLTPDDHSDLVVIGAAKVSRGLDRAAWNAAMLREFSPRLQPFLDQIYTESTRRAEAAQAVTVDDYFNLKRIDVSDAEKAELTAAIVETVYRTGRVPKERESWEAIQVEAQQMAPEVLSQLAPFQQMQAPFRAVRLVARQRINALNDAIYRERLALEGLPADAPEVLARERALAAKERDLQGLLDVWMRLRSEDGRNLAMHRMMVGSVEQWHQPEFWHAKARQELGLPVGTQLPVDVFRALQDILNRGRFAVENGQPVEPIQLELSRYLTKLRKSTLLEVISAVRKAGLLTGPKTHARNILGNLAFATLEELTRVPAVVIDFAVATLTGHRTVHGISARAVAEASRHAATKGLDQARDIFRTGSSADSLMKADASRELNSGIRWLDAYVNTVFRTMGATDRVFKSYAFRRSLEEQAALEAINRGVSPVELLASPTAEMLVRAVSDAEFATFNNPNTLAEFVTKGKAALKRLPGNSGKVTAFAIDMAVPFVNTPSNILARMLDYTPGGALLATSRAGLALAGAAKTTGALRRPTPAAIKATIDAAMTPEQQRLFAQGIARGATGSALIYLGWMLAAAGMATGMGDDDEGDRNVREAAGMLPGAVKIGDRWHQIATFSPAGNLVSLGATVQRTSTKPLANELMRGTKLAAIAGRLALEQPMLKGMNDLIQSLQRPEAKAEAAAGAFAGSFVPTLVNDIASAFDPYRRENRPDGMKASLWSGVTSRLPGLRNQLPTRLTVLGDAQQQDRRAIWDPTIAVVARDLRDDVLRELVARDVGIAWPRQAKGETAEAYRQRIIDTGEAIRARVSRLIEAPAYQRLSENDKAARLEDAIRAARERVRPVKTGGPPMRRRFQ